MGAAKEARKKKKKRRKDAPQFNLEEGADSISHGVQPFGNLLFNSSPFNARDVGLGALAFLSDEIFLDILGLVTANDLGVLALVSKAFYVFTNQESLWRNLVLCNLKGSFNFFKSWKSTYVSSMFPNFSPLQRDSLKVAHFYSDYLFQSWLCANLEIKKEWLEVDNIERRRLDTMSNDEFIRDFEEPNKPVLIVDALSDWPAMKKWDRDYLISVSGDKEFAAGPVEMKLNDYFMYADNVKEERPLYLFDPKFAEKVPQLEEDYKVPIYFQEDLFSLLREGRPDYRWLILGPSRSGSSFHIDPNSTSAWNAIIKGSKKWILFPPDVTPPGVYPSEDGAEVASPVSIIEWFMNFYGQTKHCKKRPIECICKAGEIVFVPNGWWHLVINLEDSIAITQNYVSRRNLLNVLEFLSRPNSEALVSGTRDRGNLHDKFIKAYERLYPGSIEELKCKEDKVKKKSVMFWDSVTDSKAGGFKFGF